MVETGKENFSCTQYNRDIDILTSLVHSSQNHYFCQYISIYTRIDNEEIDKWRIKFFETMGGKSHITCQCYQFPLIPSSKIKFEKSQCNLKRYIQDNNSEIQTTLACTRKESFVCSNVNCNLRVCNKCYKSFPEDKMTMIIPDTSNAIDYEDNI